MTDWADNMQSRNGSRCFGRDKTMPGSFEQQADCLDFTGGRRTYYFSTSGNSNVIDSYQLIDAGDTVRKTVKHLKQDVPASRIHPVDDSRRPSLWRAHYCALPEETHLRYSPSLDR